MKGIQESVGALLGGRELLTMSPDAMVAQAVFAMREKGYTCVLVVEREKLVGIFTERDYLHRVCGTALPHNARLAEVMTRDPETLYADDEVAYAINLMATGAHRSVPVVDADHRPVGVYTVSDVLGHLDRVFSDVEERERPWQDFEEWVDLGGEQ